MASIFARPAKPLAAQLADKAAQLRTEEADKADLATSLSRQAGSALSASTTAAEQAHAVEEALGIIEAAGVTV